MGESATFVTLIDTSVLAHTQSVVILYVIVVPQL